MTRSKGATDLKVAGTLDTKRTRSSSEGRNSCINLLIAPDIGNDDQSSDGLTKNAKKSPKKGSSFFSSLFTKSPRNDKISKELSEQQENVISKRKRHSLTKLSQSNLNGDAKGVPSSKPKGALEQLAKKTRKLSKSEALDIAKIGVLEQLACEQRKLSKPDIQISENLCALEQLASRERRLSKPENKATTSKFGTIDKMKDALPITNKQPSTKLGDATCPTKDQMPNKCKQGVSFSNFNDTKTKLHNFPDKDTFSGSGTKSKTDLSANVKAKSSLKFNDGLSNINQPIISPINETTKDNSYSKIEYKYTPKFNCVRSERQDFFDVKMKPPGYGDHNSTSISISHHRSSTNSSSGLDTASISQPLPPVSKPPVSAPTIYNLLSSNLTKGDSKASDKNKFEYHEGANPGAPHTQSSKYFVKDIIRNQNENAASVNQQQSFDNRTNNYSNQNLNLSKPTFTRNSINSMNKTDLDDRRAFARAVSHKITESVLSDSKLSAYVPPGKGSSDASNNDKKRHLPLQSSVFSSNCSKGMTLDLGTSNIKDKSYFIADTLGRPLKSSPLVGNMERNKYKAPPVITITTASSVADQYNAESPKKISTSSTIIHKYSTTQTGTFKSGNDATISNYNGSICIAASKISKSADFHVERPKLSNTDIHKNMLLDNINKTNKVTPQSTSKATTDPECISNSKNRIQSHDNVKNSSIKSALNKDGKTSIYHSSCYVDKHNNFSSTNKNNNNISPNNNLNKSQNKSTTTDTNELGKTITSVPNINNNSTTTNKNNSATNNNSKPTNNNNNNTTTTNNNNIIHNILTTSTSNTIEYPISIRSPSSPPTNKTEQGLRVQGPRRARLSHSLPRVCGFLVMNCLVVALNWVT